MPPPTARQRAKFIWPAVHADGPTVVPILDYAAMGPGLSLFGRPYAHNQASSLKLASLGAFCAAPAAARASPLIFESVYAKPGMPDSCPCCEKQTSE